MEVGERLSVIQQHKNEDVVGNETVEEKRGAAVNVVVHVDDEDKGDARQEVIGSNNTGGGGAKTALEKRTVVVDQTLISGFVVLYHIYGIM